MLSLYNQLNLINLYTQEYTIIKKNLPYYIIFKSENWVLKIKFKFQIAIITFKLATPNFKHINCLKSNLPIKWYKMQIICQNKMTQPIFFSSKFGSVIWQYKTRCLSTFFQFSYLDPWTHPPRRSRRKEPTTCTACET